MIGMIVAATPEGYIGNDGKIPWVLEGDLPRFKALTLGCSVIMGSKTFESLLALRKQWNLDPSNPMASVLSGRICIVVGRTHHGRISMTDTYTTTTLAQAVEFSKGFGRPVYLIGGASIYEEGLDFVDHIDLTLVYQKAPEYDTQIKNWDLSGWKLLQPPRMNYIRDKNNFPIPSHAYCHYVR